MKKRVGIHMRVYKKLEDLIARAAQLELPIVQCFLLDQNDRTPLKLNTHQIVELKKTFSRHKLFVHGSYFINPAHLREKGKKTLFRELELAEKLGASGFILHAGSATGERTHDEGMQAVADILNEIDSRNFHIPILLENTAHGGKSVGSNFEDFKKIKSLIKHPEKVRFCIDTAHAHAFGYDLTTKEKQAEFLQMVDAMIGLENIALIHLNEPSHPLGSYLDKHAKIGEGKLGTAALRSFALQPQIASLPIILELPVLPEQEEAAMLNAVRSW